jgi:hypothetical protein
MNEEDEAFAEIERKQNWRAEDNVRREAQQKAFNFVMDMGSIDLGSMTLQRAYEIGYRAGVYAEQRKKDEHPR